MLWAGSHSVDRWGNSAQEDILSIIFHWESSFISKDTNSYYQNPNPNQNIKPNQSTWGDNFNPKVYQSAQEPWISTLILPFLFCSGVMEFPSALIQIEGITCLMWSPSLHKGDNDPGNKAPDVPSHISKYELGSSTGCEKSLSVVSPSCPYSIQHNRMQDQLRATGVLIQQQAI